MKGNQNEMKQKTPFQLEYTANKFYVETIVRTHIHMKMGLVMVSDVFRFGLFCFACYKLSSVEHIGAKRQRE